MRDRGAMPLPLSRLRAQDALLQKAVTYRLGRQRCQTSVTATFRNLFRAIAAHQRHSPLAKPYSHPIRCIAKQICCGAGHNPLVMSIAIGCHFHGGRHSSIEPLETTLS